MVFLSQPYETLYQEKGEQYDETNEKYRRVSQMSRMDAQIDKQKLRAFYRDPFQDGTGDRFWNAEFTLDYLEIFKPEGSKRKDSPIENILHELKPCKMMMAYCKAGILPPEITYEIVDGQRREIPEGQRSIERLFCAIHIHDLDEDYPEVSEEHFLNYMDTRIDSHPDIPADLKPILKREAREDAKAMRALTFGRKTFDEHGNKIKEKTHNGDRQIYSDALESFWVAIAAKAADRYDGLITRYGFAADIFSIAQDMEYMEETRRLFMYRQSLEDAAERYPEMAQYFGIMNKRISIALRCLGAMTSHHPSTLARFPDPSVNAETARIDLGRLLPEAMIGIDHFEGKSDPYMKRMLIGFQMEAMRWPEVTPIVNQMEVQLRPYTPFWPVMHSDFDASLRTDH